MPTATRALPGLVVAVLLGARTAPVAAALADAAPDPEPGPALEVHVLDDATGDPVPWANVLLGGDGFLADERGICRVPRRAGTTGTLRVVHVAYEASPELPFETVPGATRALTVRLRPRAHEMQRVRVDAERKRHPSDAASGRRSVRMSAASALPNPADDPFLLVRLLPGVSGDDVGSNFRIRGGGVDETLVRIDGMEVRSLFHGRDFGGVTGIVPTGLVERLDVHAGAFPAELGGRTSGAIDLDLRDDGPAGLHGAAAADVTAARALLERNGSRGSVFVSAREGYLHRILDALQDEAVVQPAYRDLLVRGVRRLDAARTVSASWLRVEDHVFYEDGIGAHFVDADYVDHYAWGRMRWLAAPDLAIRGTVFGSWSEQRRRVGEDRRDDRRSRRAGGRVQAGLARGGHLWKAGVESEREWVYSDLEGGTVVRIARDGSAETIEGLEDAGSRATSRAAAWIQDEWTPHDAVALNLGLRGSHDGSTHELHLAPRAAGAWSLPAGWLVRAAWGRHVQPPRRELSGDGLLVLSERTQRSDQTVLGVEKDFGGFRVGTEAWEKRFRPIDGVVSRTIDGVTESHVIVDGISRGLDAYLRRAGRASHWWFTYSLGRSEWSDGARTYARDFDALHTLALAHTYRIGRDWELGVSYRFRTGTPYTEESWNREDGGRWVLDEGPPNGARLPDYHRVDVRVLRRFRFDGWQASVWGEALNLTNHDNVLWYAWRLREQDPQRVTRTGVPGLPSIGAEIRF